MEIFEPINIKLIDQYNIKRLNITSLMLMERAANAFVEEFLSRFPENRRVLVLAGPGNNGGDALAIARLLINKNLSVKTYLYCFDHRLSHDCESNFNKLKELNDRDLYVVSTQMVLPDIHEEDVVIDGLFGIGLNRKLGNEYSELINFVNNKINKVVSIDVPSGLNLADEQNYDDSIVSADYTFTFQYPKMKFLFAEYHSFVGEMVIIDIGLKVPENISTNNCFITINDIYPLWKKRDKFAHKGCFGKGLLVAGNVGMAGAALFAAKAALNTGIGKLFVLTPCENRTIVQIAVPEAIYLDRNVFLKSEDNCLSLYDYIAIGPGLGTGKDALDLLKSIVVSTKNPMIIDADALNIIAENKELLQLIPPYSVLTPHRGEFNRLFGNPGSDSNALKVALDVAERFKVIIVLKGAYTKIVMPDRTVCVNSSGNPGMATAGSGDVLTGVILSLIAQGYEPAIATVMAVFLHGYAGDIAINDYNKISLIASDIIMCLPKAVFLSYNNVDRF